MLLPILIFSTANTIIDQFQTINTENGPIRGQLMSTIYDAKPFYSFRGVPFAKPPINDLRFKVFLYFKTTNEQFLFCLR